MMKQGCSKIIALAKLLAASLLLIQGHAWAECAMGDHGEGGTSTIVNTAAGAPIYFKTVDSLGPGEYIDIAGPFTAQLSPALWSNCSAGTDGDQMSNITYDALGDGREALWPTNITGIYYAVRIYSDTSEGSYFQYSNDGWSDLPVHSSVASHNWAAQIKIVQSNQFIGNTNNVTRLTPGMDKKIGGMSIGGHTSTDNKPWWFNVTMSTFSLPVASSTCQAAVVNGGTNNVDFGEIMFSSIRDSFYPRQTFNLQLKGCNNVAAIKYKVSSNKTDGTSGADVLMLNILTSNAAAGVGVAIEQLFTANPSGHGEPFINDPSYIYVPLAYQVGTSSSVDLPFEATMGRDNNTPLKAGNFKAIATFTIDYF
ncbi:fimbrial protein [Enterobacter asburiae]|uniref:fimbrial protein n=1 Tax=Enterobacter asburiae TaxID=61645 RepID=UPI00165210CC|nr:fimbrial protein [Enterobacter asburiae]